MNGQVRLTPLLRPAACHTSAIRGVTGYRFSAPKVLYECDTTTGLKNIIVCVSSLGLYRDLRSKRVSSTFVLTFYYYLHNSGLVRPSNRKLGYFSHVNKTEFPCPDMSVLGGHDCELTSVNITPTSGQSKNE